MAVNALAWRVAVAMSRSLVVNVRLANRRIVGRIVQRRVREGWKATGNDGETSLEFVIEHGGGRETVRLDQVLAIERQKVAPTS